MRHALHFNRNSSVRRRRVVIGAALICAAGAASAARGAVVTVIGATLRVHNPDGSGPVAVEATFLGDTGSLYTSELFLDAPTFLGPIFNNQTTPLNHTKHIGTFQPETVLFIRNQSFFIPNPGSPASNNFGFFTGDGTLPLNPDRLPHAVFTWDTSDPESPVTVGFEDQFGGGDFDFNDAVYRFTNVRVGTVDVALTPIGIGETFTNQDTRHFADLDDEYTNEGTLENEGSLTNYGNGTNSGTVNNPSNFFNDRPAQFNNAAGAQFNNSGTAANFGEMSNEGTVTNSSELTNGGGFENIGDAFNEGAGPVNNAATGIANNIGNLFNDGTVNNTGEVVNSGTIENVGSLANEAAGTIRNTATGVANNIGNWFNSTDATIENDGQINNSGTIENLGQAVNNAAGIVNNSAEGVVNNVGNWVNAAGSQTHSDGTMNNTGGSFTVEDGASVTGEGFYQQINNAVTTVNGVMQQTAVDIAEGVVQGAGTIEGELSVGTGATVRPGNSPGTLTIDGDFYLGGTLEIELDGLTSHDLLDITGAATFDGGTIEYLFGFTPSLGDSFTFLTTGAGITGFESLTFSASGLPAGLSFTTEMVGNNLVVTAVVPEPAALASLGAAAIALTARIRKRG